MEVKVAGGAAGEDRVQVVCSEKDGWLFCGVYNGFNGRDAADFLAGTLYDTIIMNFNLLNWDLRQAEESFRYWVLDGLRCAFSLAETDILCMVEREMNDRPDLIFVGSCVLVVLLLGKDLCTLNLGDSRAVLATYSKVFNFNDSCRLKAIQLTDIDTVENEVERSQILSNHPDDTATITPGRVKGKLKVTQAFGVGNLKKKNLNDVLMGILKVCNLMSPAYISISPSMNILTISESDHFVILGSDGLFDFFTNEEAVYLVQSYALSSPWGDPAKFLLEQLVMGAADCACDALIMPPC